MEWVGEYAPWLIIAFPVAFFLGMALILYFADKSCAARMHGKVGQASPRQPRQLLYSAPQPQMPQEIRDCVSYSNEPGSDRLAAFGDKYGYPDLQTEPDPPPDPPPPNLNILEEADQPRRMESEA